MVTEQEQLRQMSQEERLEWFSARLRNVFGIRMIRVNGVIVASGEEGEAVEIFDKFEAAIEGPDIVAPQRGWAG
ncbi:MAG: hypothetical protein JSS49_07935 [Planctomycetes bacterium]|nr:hypothetical protein [Planctomycetota bacterium]